MSHVIWHKNYLKIAIITLILLWFLRAWSHLLNPEETTLYAQKTNAQVYKSAHSDEYLNIWAAISTRIWIAFENGASQNSADFYREIASIWDTPQEKRDLRSELISRNSEIIGDYLNLSRSDIKSLLDSSSDRQKTLEWFITQLELRFKNSTISLESLEKQKSLLLREISDTQSGIERVKSDLEGSFSAGDTPATLENVDEYFDLRARYTSAFTDIVFINQFIKQHSFLNEYNAWILDTLINNKTAIINQSFVVIPDSWDEYLRPLELIFDESEIKKEN